MIPNMPLPGDPRTSFFLPYIYQSVGYYYVVTPVGSFRVNETFEHSLLKIYIASVVLAVTIALFSMYKRRMRREKRRSVWNICVSSILTKWLEADGVVAKDFGRLVKCISVGTSKDISSFVNWTHIAFNKRHRKKTDVKIDIRRQEGQRVIQAMKAGLMRRVGEKKRWADEEEKEEVSIGDDGADLETIKKRQPRLFRILRAINQSVIMPAIFYICTELMDGSRPLLDRPGPDAWLVDVCFYDDGSSSIKHRRWARTGADASAANYAEICWSLTLSFNEDFTKLVDCSLSFESDTAGDLQQRVSSHHAEAVG